MTTIHPHRLARWRGGYLPPGLPAAIAQGIRHETLHFGDLAIEVPAPDAAQMQALARHVREAARRVLQPLRVSEIVTLVDKAVHRLLDPRDPWRQRADDLLPRVTGYDAEMVRLGLTAYLHNFRAPQLHRFVAEDFANPKVLDEFQPSPRGGQVRALGPALLAHGWAGNVPGLPLWSLACGLLVKAGNVGKLPSAEPVFASLFARLLAEVHPPLADCLAVVWWKGGEPGPAAALYREADCVLAYGGNEAIAQVRGLVPATTRFLGYGHKLGVALAGREALDPRRVGDLARQVAHDVVRYEQQGCYSPHVVYVERGGRIDPRGFSQRLAAELAAAGRRQPRPALALDEAAAVGAWREAAEMRTLSSAGAELLGDAQSSWAVAHAEGPLPLMPSAGWRCVQVVAVDALEAVPGLLAPHAAYLQTAALAVAPRRLQALAEALALAGVTRLCAPGAMTAPEAGWHHDGGFNLASLVRMVDIEAGAERASDALAGYAQEDRA